MCSYSTDYKLVSIHINPPLTRFVGRYIDLYLTGTYPRQVKHSSRVDHIRETLDGRGVLLEGRAMLVDQGGLILILILIDDGGEGQWGCIRRGGRWSRTRCIHRPKTIYLSQHCWFQAMLGRQLMYGRDVRADELHAQWFSQNVTLVASSPTSLASWHSRCSRIRNIMVVPLLQ